MPAIDIIRDPVPHIWKYLKDSARRGRICNQFHDSESSTTHMWHHVADIDLPTITKPLKHHTEADAHLQKITTGNAQYAVKRYKQGRIIDTTCPICGHPVEDRDHMYWQCTSGAQTRSNLTYSPFFILPHREIPTLLTWHGAAPALRASLNGPWGEAPTNHSLSPKQEQEFFGGIYDSSMLQQACQFLQEAQVPCDEHGPTYNTAGQVVLGAHGATPHDVGDMPTLVRCARRSQLLLPWRGRLHGPRLDPTIGFCFLVRTTTTS